MANNRTRMPVRDAMALIDDDLPDGAYWAMLGEMTGFGDDVYGSVIDGMRPPRKRCAGPRCKNTAPRKRAMCRTCRAKASEDKSDG